MFLVEYAWFYWLASEFLDELVGGDFHGAVQGALPAQGAGEKTRFKADLFIPYVAAEDNPPTTQVSVVAELVAQDIVHWAGYDAATAAYT